MNALGNAPKILNSLILSILVAGGMLSLAGCGSDEERLAAFMERGAQYAEEGEPEEAIIEFKNALQIDPNHAAAHEALSIAYLQVSKPREAYWEMSETVRLEPENVEARLRYGTVSAAVGDSELAIEQADAVLEIDPSSAPGHTLRAQAREALEDPEGAEEDLRAAIASDPSGPAYYYLLSGFLDRHERSDEAEATLREIIELEPSFIAFSNLARMVSRGRDRDVEAEQLLERTIEIAKEAPVEAVPRGRDEPAGTTSLIPNVLREEAVQTAYLMKSAFLYERGRFDESLAALEEGIAELESKTDLIYQMARLYRLRGMESEADALLRRATEAAPDDPAPQLVLSAYLGQQGDLDGALEAAAAAVALAPENRAAQLREAELLVDVGYRDKDPDAIGRGRAIVDAVLEAEPSSPEAQFVRAKIELADEDTEAAEASLQAALQARPDWPQARFVLGSVLAVSGEVSRARAELARALELDPALLDARRLLTQIHAQLGEHEFAIEQGRAYLEQRPGDSEIRIVVGQSLIRIGRAEEAYEEVSKIPEDERDAAAYFALGRLDVAYGRNELGRKRLLKANELSAGNVNVLRTLLALDRGAGDIEPAAAEIAAAVEAFPENSEIVELEAEVAYLRDDKKAARAHLERAVKLEPRNVSAQLALADMEREAGDTAGMIAVMEEVAAAIPESSDLQYRLAVVYEQNGRTKDAMAAYEKAISLNADLGLAKNNLAYLIVQEGGDLDRALELAQEAKQLLPEDGNTADTLGWVLLKRGVPSAAIGYLQEATERFPSDAFGVQGVVRNHLAEAYEANEEPAKAIEASRKVLEDFAQLRAAAEGGDLDEPDWAREARERIARLGEAG